MEKKSAKPGMVGKTTVEGKKVVNDTFSSSYDRSLTIKTNIKEAGQYLFWACYNDYSSNDPTSCSNCAIRSVFVDGKDVGALVFPVVNFDFQTSTHLLLDLTEGDHEIVVVFDKANYYDSNMSQDTHTYGSELYRPDNNVQYDYFVLDKADNICTGAEKETYLLGDFDMDGNVTVMDVTSIQRYVAKVIDEDIDLDAGDVTADKDVNVMDATYVLRYVAKIDDKLGIGEYKTR